MPAKRTYGMDQDFYPWSPIVTRPVLRWPDNARVALAVIVNLEHWDWEVPAGTPVAVSPMGRPEGMCTGNQPQFPHRQFPHIGGYGNRVVCPDGAQRCVEAQPFCYPTRATATRPSSPSVNFLVTQRTFVDGGNSHVSALGS